MAKFNIGECYKISDKYNNYFIVKVINTHQVIVLDANQVTAHRPYNVPTSIFYSSYYKIEKLNSEVIEALYE